MPGDLEATLPRIRIRELSLPEPLVVQKGSTLRAAIGMMQSALRPCVLVCDGRRVAGIFTERDILNRLTPGPTDWSAPIDGVMTPHPKTLTPEDFVADAIRLMTREGYRHIPLVDAYGLRLGLLSARDILGYLADHFPAEVLNLPPRLDQTLRRMDGG